MRSAVRVVLTPVREAKGRGVGVPRRGRWSPRTGSRGPGRRFRASLSRRRPARGCWLAPKRHALQHRCDGCEVALELGNPGSTRSAASGRWLSSLQLRTADGQAQPPKVSLIVRSGTAPTEANSGLSGKPGTGHDRLDTLPLSWLDPEAPRPALLIAAAARPSR